MSYILDALRRADSERDRGGVPSLHSKPVPVALGDPDDEVERRGQPLLWAFIGLSLVLVAVVAWLFLGKEARELAPVPTSGPQALATPAPLPPQPTTETPTVLAPAAAPPAAAPMQPAPASAQATPRRSARATAPKPQLQASTVSEEPVVSANQLPEDIRRELPQLSVGGAMHSKTAANRMLILNGQVFHEGDKVMPNLVLEQIKLKSAVLVYKDHRYSIDY
jgi:general secretion pathway protein B